MLLSVCLAFRHLLTRSVTIDYLCQSLMTAVGLYGRTSNCHITAAEYCERYSTRCATGVIQRKRYDKVFTDDDDDDDEDRDVVSGVRGRTAAVSDSDSERTAKKTSKSVSSVVLPSSSSTLRYSHESEANSSDAGNVSDARSQRMSSDSGSDTEAYSEGSGPVTRSAAGARPVIANGHVSCNGRGEGGKYRTRNQGRRTVHYEEADSDVDYEARDSRRTFERRRTEMGSRTRLCRS